MRIAITGGTGFVGGRLVDRLRADGHEADHLVIARLAEWTVRVPLIATAQVHILAEGVVDALPFADAPPEDLAPATPFDAEAIRFGLPDPSGFGRADLRCAVSAVT